MKPNSTLTRAALLLLAGLMLTATAAAAHAQDLDALKQRMKARYPELRKAQDEGRIGEVFDGFVDAPKAADAAASKLITDENADRQALYKTMAQREGTTPAQVGEVNGKRNFERARPGHYLKGRDGKWTQKS